MVDGEMLYNRLIDIWEEAESYTKEDVLDIILSVAEDIKAQGKQLGSDTIKHIQQLRIQAMECPICSSKLEVRTSQGYLAEAWGMDIQEDYSELYCPDCHWRE